MKNLVHFIIAGLVESADKLEVTQTEKDDGLFFEVHVAPHDRGKVIGKEGRTIRSIRSILYAVAARDKKKVTLHLANSSL